MSNNQQRAAALSIRQGPVAVEPLAGGLSNESFRVRDAGADADYVVRFGADIPVHHVDRAHERMVGAAAHGAGFAPEVVHSEPGVTVIRFIEGRTFDERLVRERLADVAALVRDFHLRMPRAVSGPARLFWVFHVVRDYARTLRAADSPHRHDLARWLALADELEAALPAAPLVFAHNDLLPANFIDDGTRLWLIDFEYAAWSTPQFDLAGIASNAGFTPDQDAALLTAYHGAAPDGAALRAHAAMKCASLLREAMWSMVSEIHLEAPGVDYPAYTAENLARLEAAVTAYREDAGGKA